MYILKKNQICIVIIALLSVLFQGCKKDDTESLVKKDPVISWTNPSDISFGTLLSTTQLNATADVAGTFVYTPAIGTKLNAGTNQDLKVDFTPTDAATYNPVSKTVKINVNAKKDPVISWTNPSDISFGTLLSATQLNATADVAGTFVYTPAIGAKLNVGTNQDLKVDFTPTDAATYNSVSKTVKINVTAAVSHSITTYTGIEFSLTGGSSTYGRFFSFDDGKIYKDNEINATIGAKIHLAFESLDNTMYYFESPTLSSYKVSGATVTKVMNYPSKSIFTVADFDAMVDDTKLSGITITETNDSFGNSSIPGVILFQLASGRKGVIKTTAINKSRLLVDIKIQN